MLSSALLCECSYFFIHSVGGHLCCFQVLIITNNDVKNIPENSPCSMNGYPLGMQPILVLLGLEVGLFLISRD